MPIVNACTANNNDPDIKGCVVMWSYMRGSLLLRYTKNCLTITAVFHLAFKDNPSLSDTPMNRLRMDALI